MSDNKTGAPLPHSVIMEGREKLVIAGVEDVDSFDENGVVCVTSRGVMSVGGSGLHIGRLSIDKGELNIEGRVDEIRYEDDERRGGFWSRLFK